MYDSKSGSEISGEKILESRKLEMLQLMNHQVFDEVPESEAAREKLICAEWMDDDSTRTSGRH